MKKLAFFMSLLLVTAVILFAGGQPATGRSSSAISSGIPSYINLDGYFPVVKQGTNVSMTLSFLPDETFAKTSNPDDFWWFTFIRREMNIDIKATPRAPGNEVKNLMFASGDLPDLWFAGITPDDIMNYGVSEKLIIPISDYINPTLMPILYKVYSDNPDFKGPSTAKDGNIYGFSNFRGRDWLHGPITGGFARPFVNKTWLDQLGLKVPETLDEYIAMLRKFKTLGADVLPDAGIMKPTNNFCIVFSALGFHWTGENSITSVGTRNGKATFIYGDKEIYRKFLETYKTMYDEGLITRDFFTMDNSARTAITMAGKGGVVVSAPVTTVEPQFYKDYVSVKPLTSELNKDIFWVGPRNYVNPNVAVITSKNKYPEAVCRMFDWAFDLDNYIINIFGYPDTMPEKNYGMINGWSIGIDDNFANMHIDDPVLYPSENYFSMSRIRPINNMVGMVSNQAASQKRIYGLNPPPEAFNLNDPDSSQRKSTYDNLSLHTVIEFPFVVYWDQVTSRRLSDLGTVLNDYADVQFAQFVTGARPISDLDRYFAELDSMGYQEYLKYYVDYYEGVKATK